jgi:hypothetical protein
MFWVIHIGAFLVSTNHDLYQSRTIVSRERSRIFRGVNRGESGGASSLNVSEITARDERTRK